jgi:hypothetical protein
VGLFRKKKTLDPEAFRGLANKDVEAIHMYSSAVAKHEALLKRERRQRRSDRLGVTVGQIRKGLPKGIKHPDSLVRNEELYIGHKVKRKGVRLY